jgi:hypothetical protein
MTFLNIQDQLVKVPNARFSEADRDQAKLWINDRYAELWGLENWTFRDRIAQVTVTAGSQTVSAVPADLGPVLTFQLDTGQPLNFLSPQQFQENYYGSTWTGVPSDYTVVNGAMYVGPTPATSSTSYQLIYEAKLTLLVNDSDVPAIPAEHHFILVHGALATGCLTRNDFTYQFAEQRWQNELEAMRRSYRAVQRGDYSQWGADPLGTTTVW